MLLLLYKNTKNKNIYIGSVEFYINADDKEEVYVTSLFVDDKFRGKKYGTKILLRLYDYLAQFTSVKYATWTDCSDRCFSQDNLYVKFGATYVEENLPEMCWNLYDRSSRMYRRNCIKQIEGEYKYNKDEDEIYIFR